MDELVRAVTKALDGCGGSTIGTFEPATCEILPPEGQDPANLRCGWLTVPENRTHPEGRTIKLAVVILAATGSEYAGTIGPALDRRLDAEAAPAAVTSPRRCRRLPFPIAILLLVICAAREVGSVEASVALA
jgi:hypothetical protein